MTQPFKINDDHTVYPGLNTVGHTVKLEPRLMKLLCLMAANAGTLVTREEIVEKIWNGYGGGDEALTQAISHLRKVLNDADKIIIETVPKSGYIFTGKIGLLNEAEHIQPAPPVTAGYISYKIAGIIGAMMIIVFGVILYLVLSGRNITPKPPGEKSPSAGYAPRAPK